MDLSELDSVLALLRREPLRHVVMLKYLLADPASATIRIAERNGRRAILLQTLVQSVAYDRRTYPEALASVMISSDAPELTSELIADLPLDRTLIWRLASAADHDAVASSVALDRRNAFLTFTAGDATAGDAQIAIDPDTAPYDLFAEQHHDADWLASLLRAGRAFTATIRNKDVAVATCFGFEIDQGIWEIGGVFTRPEHRGRGLARRVVGAALAELARRRLIARYQAAEANTASINLARALGMRHALTLTHYISTPAG